MKLLLLIALAGCGIYDSKAPPPDAGVDAGVVDADPCLARCASSLDVPEYNACLQACEPRDAGP